MKDTRYVHVVPAIAEGWIVRRYGAERALKRFATKRKAVAFANRIRKACGCVMFIHLRDGNIERRIEP
jgi:hypothetical protein